MQHKLDLAKFDCGIKFRFRGSNEHTFLEVRKITHGTFPEGLPFENFKFYEIDGLQEKTHTISMWITYARRNIIYSYQ